MLRPGGNRNREPVSAQDDTDFYDPAFQGDSFFYDAPADDEAHHQGTIGSGAPPPTLPTRRRSGSNSGAIVSGAPTYSFDDEPPLLEELGINFEHIWQKTMYILIPRKNLDEQVLADGDLAGPLVFGLILGTCLLLAGKVHFGYIYGFSVIGCIGLNLMLNLMSDVGIDMLHTVSIVGYCILPITILTLTNIFLDTRGKIGFALSMVVVLWSSAIATRFIEQLAQMHHQRYLIAYPLCLFYACFALITVF